MALTSAMGPQSGLIPFAEWQSRAEEEANNRWKRNENNEDESLTPEEQEEFEILRWCASMYTEARKAREPYETFDVCWDLYCGNVWSQRYPKWRAKITFNKVRAIITFMTAVMTDQKPRISVDPTMPGSEEAADLLRKLVDRDWSESSMQSKISLFVLFGLIWGTSFMKVLYDPYADGGRGKHIATVVAPYKVFVNRTATCIEDAEYLIHVDEQTMGWIRRNFPDKAEACKRVRGLKMRDRTDRDRDFLREGDSNQMQRIISAQNVDGNITAPQYTTGHKFWDDDDTVEIGEYWIRDDDMEEATRQKVVNGVVQMEPVIGEDGEYVLEKSGAHLAVSEIDGQPFVAPTYEVTMKPVMETFWRPKFPNGRLVLIAGGRVLLRDIPNPHQTDGFPWAQFKDYDVGSFWGIGEPLALKDCAVACNRILSQVYDILEKIGNPSFKLLKGGGVNAASIKNTPGLIIPMEDIKALEPLEKPPIPKEFLELFGVLEKVMGEVSGVNEAVSGTLPGANTAFATIDQLQESGAAPIRLKVRNLETGIERIGKLRVQLIQQWDQGARPIRMRSDEADNGEGGIVVQPAANVATQFKTYKNPDLQGQVEFGILAVSSLSTSPASMWNKWMSLFDKKLVDARWWHQQHRLPGWRTQLPRMERQAQANAAIAAANKSASKAQPPGPKATRPERHPQGPKRPHTPPGQGPSQMQNNAVR
jgi:hypothetical protein